MLECRQLGGIVLRQRAGSTVCGCTQPSECDLVLTLPTRYMNYDGAGVRREQIEASVVGAADACSVADSVGRWSLRS